MNPNPRPPGLSPAAILLVALSLSIGWGVRGNWGHEFGAMIPGALAGLAACLLSGREDWRRRAVHFAFFGALGWSFGGSISYMQVIGFTHSGHLPSQAYGFASLFLIGFIWAAIGGAGTAAAATLDRERLTQLYPPLILLFIAWKLEDYIPGVAEAGGAQNRFDMALNWFDTDWIAALIGVVVLFGYAAVRRRMDDATSLLLHLAIGWWAGFLILTVALGLRMTPPRGDNWSGCLGMVGGMLVYFIRARQWPVVAATLVAGFVGGLGFSGAQILKLTEIKFFEVDRDFHTNWHSILEQTYGFINGVGIALAMGLLARRAPRLTDGDEPGPQPRGWADPFALAFTLIVTTYLNVAKNVTHAWVRAKVVPARFGEIGSFHGMTAEAWFGLAYLLVAVAVVALIVAHRRRPLPMIPSGALGRGQLFYLLFLWWIVLANASRDFPFNPQRLATEGTIHVNACLCTILIALLPREGSEPSPMQARWGRLIAWVVALGLVGNALAVGVETAAARGLFGDEPTPGATLHIRFGPRATIHDTKNR